MGDARAGTEPEVRAGYASSLSLLRQVPVPGDARRARRAFTSPRLAPRAPSSRRSFCRAFPPTALAPAGGAGAAGETGAAPGSGARAIGRLESGCGFRSRGPDPVLGFVDLERRCTRRGSHPETLPEYAVRDCNTGGTDGWHIFDFQCLMFFFSVCRPQTAPTYRIAETLYDISIFNHRRQKLPHPT